MPRGARAIEPLGAAGYTPRKGGGMADKLPDDIADVAALLKEKLGAGGTTLARLAPKTRHRLPWRLRTHLTTLTRAEPMAAHPKLSLTLDPVATRAAVSELRKHLEAIDVADRRKGWFLGVLGGLVFNMILLVTLLFVIARWRGIL